MKKSDLFFNVLRLPVDFLMLVAAGLTTYFLRTEILSVFRPVLFEFNLPLAKYVYLVVIVSVFFIGVYAISGLYSMRSRLSLAEEFFSVSIASSAGIMLIIIYIFLRQELFDSRFLVLGNWFLVIVFVWLGRLIIRWLQQIMVAKYNFGVHRIIIVGNNEGAISLIKEINNDLSSGYRIVKHFSEPEVLLIKSAIGNPGVDEIILTHPHYSEDKVSELVDFCNENHITFKFVPNISQLLTSNFSVDVFKGIPFIEIKRTSLDGWGKVIKRMGDVFGSILGLIVFLPLFILTAFVIKWETEGPVFVRLKRISWNKEFKLLKFRSMVNNAEELKHYLAAFNERADGPLFKMRDDPRLTKTGKFIRKLRIDELPQFWNIFKGDISLVGPRPHQPDEIDKYQKHHKKVLAIKAGATGFAQISGSSDLSFEQEVALDSFYIDNWSLWMDIKIILKTVLKMFFDRSAV
ncbi:MAG: hypothetical protein A3B86_00830 [Candidatus Yanofskybacteria bacterium RIFCSPHIGHO2_02_FULL_38_22b]|uniref:Bacterial sugar transferase domain-containing protein n=1 Tax=Candidatus Yanofskybacteria bacterium RIFCSPHIGHO2_02_FULL_38_22b TaxID=1802673 RepID=A0A1F8F3I8_9BACT|nr:MAG: hypothetical protein A2816_02720 [Candidatus Yanofskybacteria bacterium RIFCSPHIGHO2_01_FULL_39_44]OGN07707.1 MAG: hypothetical protein A3B86_00830 [Candidatus Yanofskybacteria bacterium RIFCSPHIGHO2_02_FULL_38_22b]